MLINADLLYNSVFEECDWPEEEIYFIEVEEWQVGHKHEYRDFIFKYKGKFYATTQTRWGSHWQGYEYEYDKRANDTIYCVEVEKKEVVKYEWVPVKEKK